MGVKTTTTATTIRLQSPFVCGPSQRVGNHWTCPQDFHLTVLFCSSSRTIFADGVCRGSAEDREVLTLDVWINKDESVLVNCGWEKLLTHIEEETKKRRIF